MSSPSQTAPPDPADLLDGIAEKFVDAADTLDDYVTDANPPLSKADADALDEKQAELRVQAQKFNAAGMAATLASIQVDLARIKTATANAAAQLAVMTDVNKVIAVSTAVLNLATSITVSPSVGGILSASQALEAALIANA